MMSMSSMIRIRLCQDTSSTTNPHRTGHRHLHQQLPTQGMISLLHMMLIRLKLSVMNLSLQSNQDLNQVRWLVCGHEFSSNHGRDKSVWPSRSRSPTRPDSILLGFYPPRDISPMVVLDRSVVPKNYFLLNKDSSRDSISKA